jgi:hypothetical protein
MFTEMTPARRAEFTAAAQREFTLEEGREDGPEWRVFVARLGCLPDGDWSDVLRVSGGLSEWYSRQDWSGREVEEELVRGVLSTDPGLVLRFLCG